MPRRPSRHGGGPHWAARHHHHDGAMGPFLFGWPAVGMNGPAETARNTSHHGADVAPIPDRAPIIKTRMTHQQPSRDPSASILRPLVADLVRAFGRAVRAHFEDEVAREREQASTRRAEVLPKVRAGLARARAEGLCGNAWLFGSYAWGEPGERFGAVRACERVRGRTAFA